MRIIYLVLFVSVTMLSCGNEGNEKKVAVKKEEGSYISKKWKNTKEIFVESDSVIKVRKQNYYADLNKKYPDFKNVQNWFDSKPKQLLDMKGEVYKMIKSAINNNETISYTDLTSEGQQGTYKYLFVNDDAYYIYDLAVTNNKVEYRGVRRIKKGYRKEPMHDLIFDATGNLKQEVFQGEVTQDLYTKDGHIFFEFEKDLEEGSVINTVDLGVERKF